jgi:hypothetical protein
MVKSTEGAQIEEAKSTIDAQIFPTNNIVLSSDHPLKGLGRAPLHRPAASFSK